MTNAGLIFRLMLRDPVRHLAWLCEWSRLRRVPRSVCASLPLWLPLLGILTVWLFVPYTDSLERLLLPLSATLPANPALLIATLFAPLPPLYWALETVFNQVEFPDKPKETI